MVGRLRGFQFLSSVLTNEKYVGAVASVVTSACRHTYSSTSVLKAAYSFEKKKSFKLKSALSAVKQLHGFVERNDFMI